MINFSSLTGLQIPEGKVTTLTINGSPIWTTEKWEIEWKYSGSYPPTKNWYRDGPVTNDTSMGGIRLCSLSDSDVDDMARILSEFDSSEQSIFEVEFQVANAPSEFSIRLGTSYDDSAFPACLFCHIKNTGDGQNANAYIYSKTLWSPTGTPAAQLTLNTWHKLRMQLDTKSQVHKIFLDGTLIATQTNSTIYDIEVSGPMLFAWGADCYIRALRYRKGT